MQVVKLCVPENSVVIFWQKIYHWKNNSIFFVVMFFDLPKKLGNAPKHCVYLCPTKCRWNFYQKSMALNWSKNWPWITSFQHFSRYILFYKWFFHVLAPLKKINFSSNFSVFLMPYFMLVHFWLAIDHAIHNFSRR